MAIITKILKPIALGFKRPVMMPHEIKDEKYNLQPFSREQDHNLVPLGRGEEFERYSRANVRPVIGRMVTRYRLLVGCLLGYRIILGAISFDFFNLISEFSVNQLLIPL